ncbi:MAG: HAMP domain-containing histidine kinase [Campylobacteraceae bacterium]|nr:HAMP domain-containing histidine kinase [Campylobacteraceae bacterium]
MSEKLFQNNSKVKTDIFYSVVFVLVLWYVFSTYDAFEIIMGKVEFYEGIELDELLLVFTLIGFISTWFAIRRVIDSYKVNKEMEDMNRSLKKRIKIEHTKQQEQESILLHQSKHAMMGEMIENIAHQWRQPLSALSLINSNIYMFYELGELDDAFMKKSLAKTELLIQSMSETIDDFKNFFKVKKTKKNFSLEESVRKTVHLAQSTLDHHQIKITYEIQNSPVVYGFPNELLHAILNIIFNAKDALIEQNILDPKVNIIISSNESFGFIKIQDNAKGIPLEILDNIFNSYFTTKDEDKGTGIGLYMSKLIVEQNMQGKLEATNIKEGAQFLIQIPLYRTEKL